jgi:PPOX class probable F420-dependent enzyme
MAPATPPDSHADLLERPTFAHLATVRPDGAPQSNVMWFEYEDGVFRFTHTSARQKYRNIKQEPRVAFSILDPDEPYRFIEVRGTVTDIQPDPGAAYYQHLQERYDKPLPIKDADVRVIVTVTPEHYATKDA